MLTGRGVEQNNMTSWKLAQQFRDKECDICEGDGITSEWDGDSEYCLCVRENMAEARGEMLFETANGN